MNVSYEDIIDFLLKITPSDESHEGEKVITYFSPFTELPTLVETDTHKYHVEVMEIFKKKEVE